MGFIFQMIISINPQNLAQEFNQLLTNTINQLECKAKQNPNELLALNGIKIEIYIKDIMIEMAQNTSFANSIELIGGHKFPDIIANKYFGVEIKTSSQNHWKTTGNSVMETTRIEGVQRIFLLFAKLFNPIGFKVRPYQDVLSDVVVTHSPRYLIDMNLEAQQTIFAKLNLSYDQFRTEQNPIETIIKYYKNTLKTGEQLWWMNSSEAKQATNLVIKMWHNLSLNEMKKLKVSAFSYFPEIVGNERTKFGRFTLWLVTKNSVVCPNVRDLFTSGGKSDLQIGKQTYFNVPRILLNLIENYPKIVALINQTSSFELAQFWQIKVNDQNKIKIWQNLVNKYAHQISDAKHLDISQILKTLVKS